MYLKFEFENEIREKLEKQPPEKYSKEKNGLKKI